MFTQDKLVFYKVNYLKMQILQQVDIKIRINTNILQNVLQNFLMKKIGFRFNSLQLRNE